MPAKRKNSSETSTAMAGFVLTNGPAVEGSSNQSGEGDPAQRDCALIEADRKMSSDQMRTTNRVFPTSTFELHSSNFATALPGQLFCSTQILVCLWFFWKHSRPIALSKNGLVLS